MVEARTFLKFTVLDACDGNCLVSCKLMFCLTNLSFCMPFYIKNKILQKLFTFYRPWVKFPSLVSIHQKECYNTFLPFTEKIITYAALKHMKEACGFAWLGMILK